MYYSYQKKTISYLIFNDIFITAPSGLSDICSIYSIGILIINLVSDGLLEEFENDFKEFDINYVLGTDSDDSYETKLLFNRLF